MTTGRINQVSALRMKGRARVPTALGARTQRRGSLPPLAALHSTGFRRRGVFNWPTRTRSHRCECAFRHKQTVPYRTSATAHGGAPAEATDLTAGTDFALFETTSSSRQTMAAFWSRQKPGKKSPGIARTMRHRRHRWMQKTNVEWGMR